MVRSKGLEPLPNSFVGCRTSPLCYERLLEEAVSVDLTRHIAMT